MSSAGVHQRHEPHAFESDAVASLITALACYLEEVDDACRVCLKSEETTAVSLTRGTLRLTRIFPKARATTAYLRRAAGRLPGWKHSPFWRADGNRWEAIERVTLRPGSGICLPLFTRGISWEGRPVLVSVSAIEDGRLTVDLLLPCLGLGLPEMPLRRVAHGLLCQTHLLPERVARPIPLAALPRPCTGTLREFLTRTTPQNLYASQCFSLPGAGK